MLTHKNTEVNMYLQKMSLSNTKCPIYDRVTFPLFDEQKNKTVDIEQYVNKTLDIILSN